MKIRKGDVEETKIEAQMAPMIDVVFLLLIFFMLTLKIVKQEGDFNINMPISAPAQASDDIPEIPLRVIMEANPDGTLAALKFGNTNLGNDEFAFQRLNGEMGKLVGRRDNPFREDMEVEIDAAYNLHYGNVIKAVSACTGYFNPQSKQVIRYVEKIKFAPPKKPVE